MWGRAPFLILTVATLVASAEGGFDSKNEIPVN
jgi:hypothetical protein